MNKIIIITTAFFILFSQTIFAQITEEQVKVTATTSQFDTVGAYSVHDNSTGEYFLSIKSDNRFENKRAYFLLGKTTDEVIESLKTLNKFLDSANTEFELMGYKIRVVKDGYASISKTGHLENSAGSYLFNIDNIRETLGDILEYSGTNCGEYSIKVLTITPISAKIEIYFPKFDVTISNTIYVRDVNKKMNNTFPAKEGEILGEKQIKKLISLLENKTYKTGRNSSWLQDVLMKR